MLAALGCALAVVAARDAAAREIRLFAIGYKQVVADAQNYESYRRHLAALAEAADPSPISDRDPRPKLFLYPEDSALFGLFIGLRGTPFRTLEPVLKRAGGNGASVAVAGLIVAYQLPAAYYRVKFPDANRSEARLGLLALTDTVYRSFYETFRSIAITHHAWVVATANVAPARVTTDLPAALLLADPQAAWQPCVDEAGRQIAPPCAYEATTANVYNQAFVFDPSGALVPSPVLGAREGPLDGAVKKTYLVPLEQGPLEEGTIGLDLAYGDLRQARPIDIAGARVGILISKPAWMLDELGRLEAYDTQINLQPEAFSGFGSPVDDWQPDVLKQSSWSQVQKYAALRFGALAELTGNFFDQIFDAQNHVVEKATAKQPAPGARTIGQPDDVGWIAVSSWVSGDAPGEPCAAATLQARRECLAEVGRALAPGSGDARENAYVEPLARATIRLADPEVDGTRAPALWGANRRIDDAPAGARARNPRLAEAPDGSIRVVWQDDRSGVDQIRIARISSQDVVSASTEVAREPGTRQIAPQISTTPQAETAVVWQDLDPSPHVLVSFGEPFSAASPLDTRSAEQWKPAIASGSDGALHAAWIGLEAGRERLFHARLTRPAGVLRVETTEIDADAIATPLAARLDNRWSPAIAASGDTVAVAWTDFRDYAWDIFAAVSRDGGRSFAPGLRVDDAPAELERLHDDPAIGIGAGAVRVAWTDQGGRRAGCANCPKQRRPDADIAVASLSLGGSAFSANARVDDTGDGLATEDRIGFSNQWRPAIAEHPSHPGLLIAAWQDHREGNDDIYLATSADGGETWGPSRRVDDTGAGPSNQYSPALTVAADGTVTVVWQDDRDGIDHVYMTRGRYP